MTSMTEFDKTLQRLGPEAEARCTKFEYRGLTFWRETKGIDWIALFADDNGGPPRYGACRGGMADEAMACKEILDDTNWKLRRDGYAALQFSTL
jgi:hypothetical protein